MALTLLQWLGSYNTDWYSWSQLIASAMIKMEVEENHGSLRKLAVGSRFPENGEFIQKCIFVKPT